jgi:hypothetical protein
MLDGTYELDWERIADDAERLWVRAVVRFPVVPRAG